MSRESADSDTHHTGYVQFVEFFLTVKQRIRGLSCVSDDVFCVYTALESLTKQQHVQDGHWVTLNNKRSQEHYQNTAAGVLQRPRRHKIHRQSFMTSISDHLFTSCFLSVIMFFGSITNRHVDVCGCCWNVLYSHFLCDRPYFRFFSRYNLNFAVSQDGISRGRWSRGLRVPVHDGVHEGQDDPSMVRQINCMSELEWITKSDYVSYIMCRTDVIQKNIH